MLRFLVHLLRSAWIWAASLTLVLLWTPLLGAIRLFDVEPRRLRTGRWFRRLGRVLARINPWRIHISGGENLHANQAYVIVSNHQSLADIPILSHLKLDTKWLAKAELFRLPFLGWMLRMAGDVPIDRSDRRKGAKALLQCARYLRQRWFSFPKERGHPTGRSCRSTRAHSSWRFVSKSQSCRWWWKAPERRCHEIRGFLERPRISICGY